MAVPHLLVDAPGGGTACREIHVIACGHTHVPMDRRINGVRVVNAGSVGLPFDGDPRACYAIIGNLAGAGDCSPLVELRRVAYDVEKAVSQLYAVGYPAADISAYNLRTARSLGSELIYTPAMRLRPCHQDHNREREMAYAKVS